MDLKEKCTQTSIKLTKGIFTTAAMRQIPNTISIFSQFPQRVSLRINIKLYTRHGNASTPQGVYETWNASSTRQIHTTFTLSEFIMNKHLVEQFSFRSIWFLLLISRLTFRSCLVFLPQICRFRMIKRHLNIRTKVNSFWYPHYSRVHVWH